MTVDAIKNKLKSYSVNQRQNHQYTLTRFFQERFLFRLSKSPYIDRLLLKGGALVYVLGARESRFTKDIDFLLQRLQADEDMIRTIFTKIIQIEVDDGVSFTPESLRIEQITKDSRYTGTRVRLEARLGNIKQGLQIDIGVGDHVTPGPQRIEYPTLLPDLGQPILQAYSLETLIAEKFEAMISLGEFNTRFKDFYDLYLFAQQADQPMLVRAIHNTFERRKTVIAPNHPVFNKAFYTASARVEQWQRFQRKNDLQPIPFTEVGARIHECLHHIYLQIRD